jgi:uncharacterized repeat protein (TIGR03803 family)
MKIIANLASGIFLAIVSLMAGRYLVFPPHVTAQTPLPPAVLHILSGDSAMINARFIRLWSPMLVVILMFASSASAESKEKVLYSFQGGSDGQSPAGGVVFDKAGNLYGATYEGGSTCSSPGCGTIFQLSPGSGGTWTETILYGFNGDQGSYPEGGVIAEANGNLYGTTAYGGSGICLLFGGNMGCGVIYELSPPVQKGGQWTYAVLYNFQGGKDGQIPHGDLTLDGAGNLYGATLYGGGYGTCNAPYFQYCGTVFKLSVPKQKGGKWTEKVLYRFKSGTDGANPNGGLVRDSKGVIYGATFSGGNQGCKGDGYLGCGTVFKLNPPAKKGGDWTEKSLYTFLGNTDGFSPDAGVILDAKGAVYGAAQGGVSGGGIVFQLKAASGGRWGRTVVYGFSSSSYSYDPAVGAFGKSGDLYGTTNVGPGHALAGSVFRLRPAPNGSLWGFSLLYGFTGPPDAAQPNSPLVFDRAGNLYGTTTQGGGGSCTFGCGAAFEISP